ncbi:hypothetical protein PSMK_05070 [Phycisphaera mikurensis NBRC 102666]|uniref:SPOR domain-containing protein n=1 Tax=Phycisphaera mikurensis (strain NBRC 102666 / KCTC 22515 / FYK2301M01) TaxID=1142394 RepID=I0IBM8_PHYMF|nr:hypothetical protein PSMK_05070 [Phycisphaera mikurensis NBRC 102666]
MRRRFALAWLAWLACGGFPLAGCVQSRVVHDGWAEFARGAAAGGADVRLGRDPDAVSDRLAARRAGQRAHRLRLAVFEGPDRMADGHEAALFARSAGGFGGVSLLDADGVAVVYAGRYADSADPAARRALKRARRLQGPANSGMAGRKPFAGARLVPLAGPLRGAAAAAPADPLDLRGHPGLFTLQVGFFDDAAEPDRRTAAERWANRLRRDEKVEAFYYHGPNRSLVTVGLFARSEFVQEGQQEGYPLAARELQKRFPHNLGNGHTLVERSASGEALGEQTSKLVKTP